ncbi:multiple inositol polyphosphate phosphatase 1-like [Frieseomelitta varia]|uniref:multiple inositol polyphosphate phosphatase 1-like n=1 Tax=Frieseomelitta varia TaxID=561572 RepID=UPI001CB68832|nr:multiple inositol polyphosphate phosphatase 1-like [Frieseomelitta varia]
MSSIKFFAILIALFCLTNELILSEAVKYCYSDDEHPYLLAGTKTAYEVEHGIIKNTTVPNCKPMQIWMLIRHGTRNPGKEEIKNMKHNLPELQHRIIKNHEQHGNGSLCQKDLEKLRTWNLDPNLDKHKHKYLTAQGKKDLLSLGARFKDYFPELLQSYPLDSSKQKYKFRSTDSERTIVSMDSFISGLFDNVTVNNTEVVPTSQDTLLQLYKICKPWVDQVSNTSGKNEVDKLLNGSLFSRMIDNVSRRLGFSERLSFDDVLIMYTACSFENAWYIDKRSPWCAAFTKDEEEVFEYEEDLYYYYYSSYGETLSSVIGCPPLQDMFNHFTQLEKGDSNEEPQGIFYFAHSTTLQLFLTTMEIAKDSVPLKASNYESMRNRKWRTSHLAPFAANLAAVFYKCDSSNKVRFYLNEKPLDYEGCEAGVCDWEYLKKKLGFTALNCNTNICTK